MTCADLWLHVIAWIDLWWPEITYKINYLQSKSVKLECKSKISKDLYVM